MIINFFTPKLIPAQAKKRFFEREFNEKKIVYEEKVNGDINEIINKSHIYFGQLSECKLEDQSIINIYTYLNQNIQYTPLPDIQCQSIIQQHALNIKNVRVAKEALQYLSYFAKKDLNLEAFILNNINVNILHIYFASSKITESIFQFLEVFLTFSPNVMNYCLEKGIYNDLHKFHEVIDDEIQLSYNISLIKTAILEFNPSKNDPFFYNDIMEYLSMKVDEGIRDKTVQELVCCCISHCLTKMPQESNASCFNSLIHGCYDNILTYWNLNLKKIDEEIISTNYYLSFIIFITSYYFPDFLKQRRTSTWIKAHFMTTNNEKENEKYNSEIENVNIILVDALIMLLEYDKLCISELLSSASLNSNSFDTSFIDKVYDYLTNGNYKMKEISVQFFWRLCQIKSPGINANFIYPYFINHKIIEKLIDFFEQLDGVSLKSALDGVLNIVNSINQNFDNHPIIRQIRTEENFQILQRVSNCNSDEEIRNLATLILRKVFVIENAEQKEEIN